MKKLKSLTIGQWIRIALCVIFAAYLIFIILCVNHVIDLGPTFNNLYEPDYANQVTVRILKTIVIFASCYLIIEASNIFVFISKYVKGGGPKTTLLLIGNVIKYASAIAIIFLTLSAWGVDTTAIITGAGVITLVIGLGCQSLVADLVAGIFMLFEGDIKVGDVVVIDGWRGTVIQIGLRRTKIEDAVGNINIVNNSAISNIINNTRDLSVAVVEVGTEYNESIIRIEEVIQGALPEMKKNIPAIVEGPFYKGVSALGESSVNIKLVAKCKEDDKYQVERDLNREIKILFDKNNINIPFNQIVVNTRDPNEPNKTQYKGNKKQNQEFLDEQKEASYGIEEQSK